jgi:hypothetical protein
MDRINLRTFVISHKNVSPGILDVRKMLETYFMLQKRRHLEFRFLSTHLLYRAKLMSANRSSESRTLQKTTYQSTA